MQNHGNQEAECSGNVSAGPSSRNKKMDEPQDEIIDDVSLKSPSASFPSSELLAPCLTPSPSRNIVNSKRKVISLTPPMLLQGISTSSPPLSAVAKAIPTMLAPPPFLTVFSPSSQTFFQATSPSNENVNTDMSDWTQTKSRKDPFSHSSNGLLLESLQTEQARNYQHISSCDRSYKRFDENKIVTRGDDDHWDNGRSFFLPEQKKHVKVGEMNSPVTMESSCVINSNSSDIFLPDLPRKISKSDSSRSSNLCYFQSKEHLEQHKSRRPHLPPKSVTLLLKNTEKNLTPQTANLSYSWDQKDTGASAEERLSYVRSQNATKSDSLLSLCSSSNLSSLLTEVDGSGSIHSDNDQIRASEDDNTWLLELPPSCIYSTPQRSNISAPRRRFNAEAIKQINHDDSTTSPLFEPTSLLNLPQECTYDSAYSSLSDSGEDEDDSDFFLDFPLQIQAASEEEDNRLHPQISSVNRRKIFFSQKILGS